MKKITASFILTFIALFSYAQKNIVLIKPGESVGELKLGMSPAQTYNILKGNITWRTYQEELSIFTEYAARKISTDSLPQFIIGFDSCAAYMGEAPENLPVYKLYFKNGQLIYFIITSYEPWIIPEEKKITQKNRVGLFTGVLECAEKMNSDYISLKCGDYDGEYIYYKEGIQFIFDEQIIRTICVFTPLPDYKKLVADKISKQ
ncbi:hypothetical protein ACQ33O_12770 [Ferruginibacter sp. SUN002]|uniref:hypothetical protein n=1 Tax=Ferruginibacter sp. SUN002 TaxID=2937789 RepID=UPI003D35B465